MDLSPPVLILFIAATGFLYCNWCCLIKYDVMRESGHRLYLAAVFYGFVFNVAVYYLFLIQQYLWVHWLERTSFIVISDEHLFEFIPQLTFVLVLIFTIFINQVKSIQNSSLIRAWEKSDIDSLCTRAYFEAKPVMVTLENRKVYIGLIDDALEPGKDAHLTLIPLFSGYRKSYSLALDLTLKYKSVEALLEKLEKGVEDEDEEEKIIEQINDYRVVIPRDRIMTISVAALGSNFGDSLNPV